MSRPPLLPQDQPATDVEVPLEAPDLDITEQPVTAGEAEEVALGMGFVKGFSRRRPPKNIRNTVDDAGAGFRPTAEITERLRQHQADPLGTKVDPGRHGQMNMSLLYADTPEDVKQLIDQTPVTWDFQSKPRMGVQTHQATIDMSKHADMSIEKLIGRQAGELYNAEQLTKARNLMLMAAEELSSDAERLFDFSGKFATPRPATSEIDLYEFRKKVSNYAAIQYNVQGAVKETARALNSMRITASADLLSEQQLSDLMFDFGKQATSGLAWLVHNAKGDPAKIARIARRGFAARSMDVIEEIWIQGLLSGFPTTIMNLSSNLGTSLWGVGENYAAALSGTIRAPWAKAFGGEYLTPDGKLDRYTWGEANASLYGMLQGSLFGLRAAAETLIHGQDVVQPKSLLDPNATKIARRRGQGVTANTFGLDENTAPGKVVDAIGEYVIRYPTRLLGAGDELFKWMNYTSSLNQQAWHSAWEQGLKGDDFYNHVHNFVNDPPPAANLKAINYAREYTFTEKVGDPLGRLVVALQNIPILGKFIQPFSSTPVNVVKWGFKRSPAGLPLYVRDLLAPENLGGKGGAEVDKSMGRLIMGSVAASQAWLMFHNYDDDGNHRPMITGAGPNNFAYARTLRETGWRPYSVYATGSMAEFLNVPDGTYVPYNRADPLGMMLGSVSTALEMYNSAYVSTRIDPMEKEELPMAIAMGMGEYFADKAYSQGFNTLLGFFNGRGKPTEWANKTISSLFSPTAVKNVRNDLDPFIRDANRPAFLDETIARWQNRIPGFSEGVAPEINMWGETILRGEPYMFGLPANYSFNLMEIHAAVHDPITQHLVEVGYGFTPPDSVLTYEYLPGQKLRFDLYDLGDEADWLYAQYKVSVGKARRGMVANTVETADYKAASSEEKYMMIHKAMSEGLQQGELEFIMEHKQTFNDAVNGAFDKLQARPERNPTLPPHYKKPVTF